MFTILRKELQIIIKEKGTFFWLIILPIAFIVLYSSIFGSSTNSKITVNYIDRDKTTNSKQFMASIADSKGFAITTDTNVSLAEQKQKIKNGKLSSLLIISKGFGETLASGQQAKLEFYRTSESDQKAGSIQALLHNIINEYREGKIKTSLVSAGKSPIQIKQIMSSPIAVNEVNEDVKKISAGTQFVPGMLVMFVFFIMINMSRAFIKERDSGMLARLRSTPMKPINYLMGMWSSFILTVIIQCAILLSFGHFVYQLNLGNLTAIISIVIALSICATGMGLAISFLVKSENQGVAFVQIVVMGGAALGGLWFPFDLLPGFAQKIGYFTPQYWAQNGLQNIMIRGADFNHVLTNLSVLLLFGVLGIVVALFRFKHYILSAAN